MADWKSNLIDLYRLSTTPCRWWQHARRQRSGRVPVYSVFYHRISDHHPNPWTMNREDFVRQIDWFQENFQIVDLQECQRRISSGFNTQPTLAITFDDGYSENCEFALPLLIERRIPVTYFVTNDQIIHQRPFQHDLDFGQPLPVNTIDSLRALDLAGVEIGAHSRTHADIGKLTNEAELYDELIASSHEIAEQIGRAVRYFAFPFGQRANLSPLAFKMLKKAGFLGACTTLGGWNEIGGDPFQISRLHGDPNFQRMKNWLSYDPRLAKVRPFDYQQPVPVSTHSQKRPQKKAERHTVLFPSANLPLAASSSIPSELR